MTRILIGFAMAVVLALTSGAQAKALELTFQKLVSEEARIIVKMPGEAKEEKQENGGLKFVVIPSTSTKYWVQYTDLDLEESDLSGQDKQTLLKRFQDSFREGTSVSKEKELSLGDNKIPGREFTMELIPNCFVRVQVFLEGKRLFFLCVMSVADEDYLNGNDADTFFDSFEITAK